MINKKNEIKFINLLIKFTFMFLKTSYLIIHILLKIIN